MKYNLMQDCPMLPLVDLLEFIVDNRGKTVPTSEGAHVLIATNCIKNTELYPVFEKVRYLDESTYNNWFRAHPKPGDIIFVNKGTPGRVCMVPNPVNFCIAQDMIALRAKKEIIYNKYLFAVLRSSAIQKQIYNTNVGDVIPHFKKSFLNQLYIPVPAMHTQKEIGDIYFELSKKIDLNNRINKNLEAQAQAIFKSWFVDFEPFQDDEFSDSELGEIPKGWKVVTLSGVCSLIARGITPKYTENSGQIILNQKCIREHQVSLAPSRYHVPKKVNEKWLQYGDILVNSTGQGTLGRTAQWFQEELNITVDSHVTIVRPQESNKIYYIGQFIMGKEYEIESMASGSTGQTELSRERLGALKVIIPPSRQLEDFSDIVEPFMKKITINNQETIQLAKLRDTLLPKLMSGEIQIPQEV